MMLEICCRMFSDISQMQQRNEAITLIKADEQEIVCSAKSKFSIKSTLMFFFCVCVLKLLYVAVESKGEQKRVKHFLHHYSLYIMINYIMMLFTSDITFR